MKKIFLSVVIICALAVAGIGGVLADWVEDDYGDYCASAGYLNLVVDVDNVILDNDAGTGGDQYVGQLVCDNNLEPGMGDEVTLSFHVHGDATILGANLYISGTILDDEGLYLEPEHTAGDLTPNDGELQDFLLMKLWWDDGDNIYQAGEGIIFEGTLTELLCCIGGPAGDGYFVGFLDECVDYYIGVEYHLATYVEDPDVNQVMDDEVCGNIYFVVEAVHVSVP